jgi:thymidine kinase
MDKDFILAWVIKNSIAILAWATLAIVFNKWWIALFALLFMSNLERSYKTYRICDKCGKHSPYADSYNEALDKARNAGWIHIVDGNKDYCPDCKNKINFKR